MGFIKERKGEGRRRGGMRRGCRMQGAACSPATRSHQHQAAACACNACASVSSLLPQGRTHSLIKICKLLYRRLNPGCPLSSQLSRGWAQHDAFRAGVTLANQYPPVCITSEDTCSVPICLPLTSPQAGDGEGVGSGSPPRQTPHRRMPILAMTVALGGDPQSSSV